jgi:CubicO group peptidase (beta-lactamase class C family)
MFPNPALQVPTASGALRGGVDKDYLEPLGGEAAAVIANDSASRFASSPEPVKVLEAKTGPWGSVELDKIFPASSNRILYAYAELDSDRKQGGIVHFGVDDSAKVWVNGKLVHSHYHPGRPVTRWDEEFPIELTTGKNRILIKVDNGWMGAGFMFEPFTPEDHHQQLAERAEQRLGEEPLEFADGQAFIRSDSVLPDVSWKNSALASLVLGSANVSRSWYGPDGKPATAADQTGLYTAIATYRTGRGLLVRRAVPLLRTPADLWHKLDWEKTKLVKPDAVSAPDWKRFEKTVTDWVGGTLRFAPYRDSSAAIAFSELITPPKNYGVALGSQASLVRWEQRELDLKRQILGLHDAKRVGPTRRSAPAPVLRVGTPQQAGIKPEAVNEFRKIAADWAAADHQPFVLVLARHGIVFLHESFGKLDGKALPLDHRFRPASIGKNFAALVFAQFVERGWLKPGQIVGEVLPSWPKSGDKVVTFRQLFDHTAGLHGHTTYGGLGNPWLEEIFAGHVLPYINVGLRYEYEGDGGNIAAKAMELIDGRAFPILQREVLFSPIGANSVDQWDCGWAGAATALDMAKVGQMLLQKGAYGDWQFFSEETWRQLLPARLASFYPKLTDTAIERGIGLEHLWDPEDEAAPAAAAPAPKKLHTVGHGSASTSIYRIDYPHDIVMVAGRIAAPDGQAYDKYQHAMVRTLESAVMN